MGRKAGLLAVVALLAVSGAVARAGELEPTDPTAHAAIVVKDHAVRVVILNGFAQTEVTHTFLNRGSRDLEATYSFPLPKSASLSELSILSGDTELQGEVLPKKQAARIYEEERDRGGDAALGTKDGYQTFDFAVSPVRAGRETAIRFVYYQPLEIDTGIGRYLYPLESGGTDDGAGFWTPTEVEGTFSFAVELKSAHPVLDVRLPGYEDVATVDRVGDGHMLASLTRTNAKLDRDIVFYYRLKDGLPGRVELIPYRAASDRPGTFMLVVTPGIDLKPIDRGADYTFVLDVSGSMEGKIGTLIRGVSRTLKELSEHDRFRIIAFNTSAQTLTGGFLPGRPEDIARGIAIVERLAPDGGTDLYQGLSLGLSGLDADRAQSVVLVTDAVANRGVIDPAAFHDLAKKVDVRVFGFLMGNNANWPLMRTVCDASGGFWAQVSNADDILGQLLLAKSKVTHECLHDAELRVEGVKVFDTTDAAMGKVFRGEQLTLFGRYENGGKATVTLKTRITGEDRVYHTTFEFPETDLSNPEVERLWALHRIEAIEAAEMIGVTPTSEAEQAVRDLGVAYQLVTDQTSMIVLADDVFEERGIDRANRERVRREREAQAVRSARPAPSRRVDEGAPMFKRKTPGIGGGAIDPLTAGLVLGIAAAGVLLRRRRRR